MDKRERNDIFRVLDEETLKNSKKDVRSRSFLFPKRILWTAGQVENSRRLLEKEEMQISLAAHEPCILKNEKGEKASILLDYGIRSMAESLFWPGWTAPKEGQRSGSVSGNPQRRL